MMESSGSPAMMESPKGSVLALVTYREAVVPMTLDPARSKPSKIIPNVKQFSAKFYFRLLILFIF